MLRSLPRRPNWTFKSYYFDSTHKEKITEDMSEDLLIYRTIRRYPMWCKHDLSFLSKN